ncbi:hypothetical protein BGZ93_009530 [Podila epicladia]|nr:hypothetical protein BGZ92_002567 [Podila epicladia]KAG0099028.1 hypothetical protein BGZ93_009530 [Podila epicladia]
MGVKLFNDLITVLDVLPSSHTVDICVNHPSTVAIVGKVRIIAKRPCVYKSLVLTATGNARIIRGAGSRLQSHQLFLHATTDVVHQSPLPSSYNPGASSAPTSPVSSPTEENPRNSLSGGFFVPTDANESTSSPEQTAESTPSASQQPSTDNDTPADSNAPQMTFATNQLHAGVNDIDFRLEFPSHYKSHLTCPQGEVHLHSLPTGSLRTGGDSTIDYCLRTTLTLSRRDVLVNNSLSVTIPFKVQTWQDQIDQSHGEEHAYHGKRRGKIEFEFHVPKQLDARRLHELHFGFQGGWKVLDERLKVDKVHYYIVEEEAQMYDRDKMQFVPKANMETHTTIISTTATYDCAQSTTPTNTWEFLETDTRLQIPQPNLILQPLTMPGAGILSITHKLRLVIQFDKNRMAEKDLQLSFPILIHPALEADGAPVHPELTRHAVRPHRQRRGRRAQRVGALYINNNELMEGSAVAGEEDDDDVLPLPVYADREESLLLMVGEEVQELDYMDRREMDALGISISTTRDPEFRMSSSESGSSPISSLASPPLSPISSTFSAASPTSESTGTFATELRGGATAEQHTWDLYSNNINNQNNNRRSASLSVISSTPPAQEGLARRMYSSLQHSSPPPYILPNGDGSQGQERRTQASEPIAISMSSSRQDVNIPLGLPSPPYEPLDHEVWHST